LRVLSHKLSQGQGTAEEYCEISKLTRNEPIRGREIPDFRATASEIPFIPASLRRFSSTRNQTLGKAVETVIL
ncbi:MAG: hypothetical protein RLY72_1509, partial [Planctomycetota bacterium]